MIRILQKIYSQVDQEKRGMRYAPEDAKRGNVNEYEAQKQKEEKVQDYAGNLSQKLLEVFVRYPHVKAELYRIFLNRLKSNYHLVF